MAIINFTDKVALNDNPNVQDKNKVKDSDLNLIKQVGNQTIKTLGLYTDNWSSSGTYNIDDIVINDNRLFKNITGSYTTTEPKNDTLNWEETTIILNEQSSSQINTYSCVYINGITDKTPKYCVATTTGSTQTIGSYYTININKIEWGNGNFTLSNNGIKIGAGIHHVRISGAFFIDNWPSGYNYIWGQILLNGYRVSGSIASSGASYISIVVPTTIISVSQNDIITFVADAPVGQGTIRNGVDNTWLCIEKID